MVDYHGARIANLDDRCNCDKDYSQGFKQMEPLKPNNYKEDGFFQYLGWNYPWGEGLVRSCGTGRGFGSENGKPTAICKGEDVPYNLLRNQGGAVQETEAQQVDIATQKDPGQKARKRKGPSAKARDVAKLQKYVERKKSEQEERREKGFANRRKSCCLWKRRPSG